MINFLPVEIKSPNEKILTPYQYVKLVETNVNVIETAKFIPPVLGSNQVLGKVWVKFRPGYRYTSN